MPLAKGQWHNVKCKLGHTHRIYIQQKTDECSIACAAMAIQRIYNKEYSLAVLRQQSQDHGGGYRPGLKDAGTRMDPTAAAKQDAIAAMISRKLNANGYAGTYAVDNLPSLLKPYGVNAAKLHEATGTNLRNVLKTASVQRPFILNIYWESGGGHSVFVDRHYGHALKKDEFCICDPADGVHVVTLVPDAAYHPQNSWATNIPYAPDGHLGSDFLQISRGVRPPPPPARRQPGAQAAVAAP